MTPATHRGTCQICSALQKLPEGVLSKHGYTKRWGFFSGTCAGSGYRPFEQATDRVEYGILKAEEGIAGCRAQIAGLTTAPIGVVAPFLHYDSRHGLGYYETEVTITLEEVSRKPAPGEADPPKYTAIMLTFHGGERVYGTQYGLFGTVENAVRKLRLARIGRIEKRIAEYERYIAWQRRRLAEWEPKPLKLVRKEVAA